VKEARSLNRGSGPEDAAAAIGTAERPGVFLDFDGTLAEIVERPHSARAVPGALAALERLMERGIIVAVVSGRTPDELAQLVDVPGVRLVPLYGFEPGAPVAGEVIDAVARTTETIPGLRIERKRETIAVHARGMDRPDDALRAIEQQLTEIASDAGFELLQGKQVLELVPVGRARKGAVVAREAEERDLDAVLFAGDDLVDLEAFEALDRLAATGIRTLRVAVDGPETPDDLLARADVVVAGPAGLVRLLAEI
jgi:trehalose 6-phosphate phosphatase